MTRSITRMHELFSYFCDQTADKNQLRGAACLGLQVRRDTVHPEGKARPQELEAAGWVASAVSME